MTGRGRNVGLGLCAVLAAVDIIGLVGLAVPDEAPPAFVMVVAAILGALSLAALRPAHAGRRGGMATVVSSRVLSALWGIPVYFAPDAPGWAEGATAVFIALTAVALGLLPAGQREEAYAPAGR